MSIVSISEAAKLVRRGRASLYRDIDKGRLSKTVSSSGEAGVDTSELVRVYGNLYLPEQKSNSHKMPASSDIDDFVRKVDGWTSHNDVSKVSHEAPGDSARTSVLDEKLKAYEHRIELLERIISLEATVRKDTTAALKAQIADKDIVLKALENQLLMLSYPKPAAPIEEETMAKQRWWSRLIKRS